MKNQQRIRRDFSSLTKTEIEHLNEVFQKVGSKLKNSDYQDIAGFHGLPKQYCHVDDPRDENDESRLHSFLGWHRVYLLEFENRLRKVDPNFTLPYLDWASDKCVNLNNIPSELDSYEYLKGALIGLRNQKTTRNKSRNFPLSDLRQNLIDIFANNFTDNPIDKTQDFSNYIQTGAHNSFHGWMGGSMGQVAFAAFDPIFWMHHSNIDRIWTVWQKSTFGSEIQKKEIQNKASYLNMDFSKRGFPGIKYSSVIDNKNLPGGVSVVYENEKTPFSTRTHAKSLNFQPFGKSNSSVIRINNLGHTLDCYVISVNGSISDNVVHFGTICLFGHGDCCTEEECKRVYKGPRDTFSSAISSFDLKTTDVDFFILQIDDSTENKRVSVETFQKALLREENFNEPLNITFTDVGENPVVYKFSSDCHFRRPPPPPSSQPHHAPSLLRHPASRDRRHPPSGSDFLPSDASHCASTAIFSARAAMEWPPPRRLLLLFLLAFSWRLGGGAGIGGFGVGAEELSSNGASFSRRLLQIGGENQGAGYLFSHAQAPKSGPVSAPSPSAFISSPPEGAPSPFYSQPTPQRSPLRHDPSIDLPHPLKFKPAAGGAGHDHSAQTPSHSVHKHSWTTYGLVAAGVAAFLIISAAGALYCRAKRVGTVKPWVTGLSGQLQKAFVTGVPALKRSELESASEDFSNIIGSTSSCMMYKGTLSSGVEIAVASSLVTSAKDWSKECESQYRKKITSLSKVNHRNFMNLLGYCEEGHPFTRAMVFEYAPNGTLFEYLHVREAEKLDWVTRLRISMGIAYCLEHMHQLSPPVVPRSLDSTTIYLTDDFAAKVSDLEFPDDAKGPSPRSTNGALDPSSELENAVHRYGVVLLEILTGRVACSDEDGPLERWASRYLDGEVRLAELMDPSIGSSFSEEAARALCEVARSCVDPDPKRRPAMAEVAARLKEITALGPDGATPKVSPLWWAELEIMSSSDS